MKKDKFSVLIVGLGDIGLSYDLITKSNNILTHVKAIKKHSSFNLIGAVDINFNKRKLFRKKYNLPVFSSVKESFLSLKPDIITIAVPTKNHFKVLKEITNYSKPKIILCEKPFCGSYRQSVLAARICKLKKIKIFVNYARHCLPGVNKVKLMFKNRAIKLPIKGNVWFSRGYFNNGSHFIELLNHWLGPIKKVELIGENSRNKIFKKDLIDFRIHYKKGLVNFIENESKKFSHQSIELLSINKRIYWSHYENLYIQKVQKNSNFPKYNVIEKFVKKIDLESHKIQWHVYDQLERVLRNKPSNICNIKNALKICKVLYQLKKLS